MTPQLVGSIWTHSPKSFLQLGIKMTLRAQAVATQMIDDARVRVTRFDFAPGAETGWHTHGMDYVITTITECHLLLEHPDGTTTGTIVPAGSAYQRIEGTKHNVINIGAATMTFIEVELK
jgi:quercetin dioxygenase-like cupin family protein